MLRDFRLTMHETIVAMFAYVVRDNFASNETNFNHLQVAHRVGEDPAGTPRDGEKPA